MLIIGPLAFHHPWILLGLLGIPLLWILIRLMPPSSSVIAFPAVRLLHHLRSPEEIAKTAPWWLLLLRISFVIAMILGFSHPVLVPQDDLPGKGALILVINNDWSSARNWPKRIRAARSLIKHAERENRSIYIITTIPVAQNPVSFDNKFTPPTAQNYLKTLQPRPWPSDLTKLLSNLKKMALPSPADVVWLTDKIEKKGKNQLAQSFQRLGSLTILTDESSSPKILSPPIANSQKLTLKAFRLNSSRKETIVIQAFDNEKTLVDYSTVSFQPGDRETIVNFSLPIELRNKVTQIKIKGEPSAAAVILLDDSFKRYRVGLVSNIEFETEQPLLNKLFYLEQAISPFSEIHKDNINALLSRKASTIIMADIETISKIEESSLTTWMENGGVLIRFAGPHLAAHGIGENSSIYPKLLPVELRGGDRTLEGVLSWTKPLPISEFNPSGPFNNLPSYPNVLVQRQVLAEPDAGLNAKTWARLQDGTPIVTGVKRGDGWLVLFHTTANPEWSNLALSGLFVDMLQRLISLGLGNVENSVSMEIPPIETLNGFGILGPPEPNTQSIALKQNQLKPEVTANHPPGFYGNDLIRSALNLNIDPNLMVSKSIIGKGVIKRPFDRLPEVNFRPIFLVISFVLLILDLLISLMIRGYFFPDDLAKKRTKIIPVLLLIFLYPLILPTKTLAQTNHNPNDGFALEALSKTTVAFVITGEPAIDSISKSGLSTLTDLLRQRTAVDAGPPIGVNLAMDELSFFPLIYWPIVSDPPELDDVIIQKVNAFMKNGGTIFFDTRDQYETSLTGTGNGIETFNFISNILNLPFLTPIPSDHVLTKSFYLLKEFPGRFTGGELWIKDHGVEKNPEISPIIIGSHDWASAWARDQHGNFRFPIIPHGEEQRELSFRAGINLIMYVLTGNYKADQVHVPAILERLGQ